MMATIMGHVRVCSQSAIFRDGEHALLDNVGAGTTLGRMAEKPSTCHKPIVSVLEIGDDDAGDDDGERVVEITDES
ncbi:hypothetical protein EVAR_36113_1 [Eumeta japonica]|uniref:Uncharacterized protein n=1 Tax=Eumeta variegata TaxID=151549 RepID=A0A4C1X1A4_EUMVA|nr:hypothetical protein EVAR_36113_1 [Eumeta japonica]